jgi:hypothetical protein
VAFICSLVVPLYFFILMADGRKLQERLRVSPALIVADVQEDETPLIDPDTPLWMAHPYGEAGTKGRGVASVVPPKFDSPGADGIFG